MLKSKKAERRADEEAAKRIMDRVLQRASDAGLVKLKRKRASLPPNLDPDLTISQRRRMHEAMEYFEAAHAAGETVLHLTWCPAAFYFKPGDLNADAILRFARVASRSARNLPVDRRRLIGAIDISFNKETGIWCVHLHALVVIRGKSLSASKKAVKQAYPTATKGASPESNLHPRKAKHVKTEQHLLTVFSYVSGCLALVDHNDYQRRDRRLRTLPEGSTFSSKSNLPDALQVELTQLYATLVPSRFWVLSGFRRHGSAVSPEPPLHPDEQRAKAQLMKPRPEPKPFTISAISKQQRLF